MDFGDPFKLIPQSIMKSPTFRGSEMKRVANSPRVTFQPPAHIAEVLQDYYDGKAGQYNQLLSFIADTDIADQLLSQWLVELQANLHLLDRKAEAFIQSLLKLQWASRSRQLKKQFRHFIFSLLSAHNYYTKAVLRFILTSFAPNSKNDVPVIPGSPSEEEVVIFTYCHQLLSTVLSLVPMTDKLLDTSLSDCFPYITKPTHQQACYVINLLHLSSYVQHKKQFILTLILSRLTKMDASVLREDLEELDDWDEEMEEEKDYFSSGVDDMDITTSSEYNFVRPSLLQVRPMGHVMADKLDVLLTILMEYIYRDCHSKSGELDWEATKKLYREIWVGFETVVLCNHALSHVQFVMLYICSFKSMLYENFLASVWRKVCTISMQTVLRQNAAVYLGGFLARAEYVPLCLVQHYMQEMARWAHAYVRASQRDVTDGLQKHPVFYSVCQSLFYLVVFFESDLLSDVIVEDEIPKKNVRRKEDLEDDIQEDKKGLVFLQSLELNKLLTSHLNPMAVCPDEVLGSLIRMVHTYQLAYCFSVMQYNGRNWLPVTTATGKPKLDSKLKPYFPFDPCLLQRCSQVITPIYRQYREKGDCDLSPSEFSEPRREKEDDDYLEMGKTPKLCDLVAMGTSPPLLFEGGSSK